MKFRVERDALADAIAWTARSLPSRPAAPVLAGVLLEATDGADGPSLTVSGFDYEVSTRVSIGVAVVTTGRVLVSGRLLADITKALPPHPVDVSVDGSRVAITCGSSKFTLPTMPVEDYPRLPDLPATAGTVGAAEFAKAVASVAIAAGRDDTLPMLTGVRLEIDGDRLTFAATDRYRLAVRELSWSPADPSAEPVQVLVPAKTLADVARSLTGGGLLTLSLGGVGTGNGSEGIIGFTGGGRHTTTRLLDATFPPYRTLLPTEWTASAEVDVPQFVDALKRVALVADRGTPVRLDFAEGGVSLSAGAEDEGRAEEQIEADYTGDAITTAFNPTFLIDGLTVMDAPVARLLFTTPTKPAVLRPLAKSAAGSSSDGNAETGSDGLASEYTYLIMPVRLPG
ncbi:MAG: polymerase subunit beta [Pseudonocardiales bacterium]|nr:polymerase subunit beta [Pseudonocardiales bacterium]